MMIAGFLKQIGLNIESVGRRTYNNVIFIYSGSADHPLYAQFVENAKHFQQDEHMYSVTPALLAPHIKLDTNNQPVIVVYKDKHFTKFVEEKVEGERLQL